MSLESILEHILNDAHIEAQRLIQQAKKEAEEIIQEAHLEAEKLYRDIIDKEITALEKQKQKLIVGARLEAKKNLLKAKQELIDKAFGDLKSQLKKDKFKKQQVSPDTTKEVAEDLDFYLTRIRLDLESEIAEILFK